MALKPLFFPVFWGILVSKLSNVGEAVITDVGFPVMTVSVPETVTLPAVVTVFTVNTDNAGGLNMTSGSAEFIINLTPAGAPDGAQTVKSDATASNKVATITLVSIDEDPLRYDTNPVTPSITTTLTINDGTTVTKTLTVNYVANVNDEDVQNLVVTELDGSSVSDAYTTAEQTFTADTNIFLLKIDDADFDDTISPITTRLQPSFNDTFGVQNCTASGTRPIYECNLFVKSGVTLDYERQNEYLTEVTFSDGISELSRMLTVSVTNEVDELPTWEPENMPNTIFLAENLAGVPIPSSEVIYQVHGVNNDFNHSDSSLEYSLVNNLTNNLGQELFAINSSTGEIFRTTNELSFEDLDISDTQLHLEVMVNLTTGDGSLAAIANLTINVTDVCEPPFFTSTQMVSLRFDENGPTVGGDLWLGGGPNKQRVSGPNPAGYDLTVEDPDAPQGGDTTAPGHKENITYSISPNANSHLFYLDCDGSNVTYIELDTSAASTDATCNITWKENPDFETLDQRPTFVLNIVATDSCGATAEYDITIAVRNDNDNLPIFLDTASYDVTIPEMSPRGYYVTEVAAYDPDADPDNSITYSLQGFSTPNDTVTGNYYFSITTVSQASPLGAMNVGKIYVYYPWDRETRGNSAVVRVYARDSQPQTPTYAYGGTSTEFIDVNITFSDINDNRPIIHTFWNREVPYNERSGFDIGIDLANNVSSSTLNDEGVNNDFEFRFMAPTNYFSIDSVLGTIAKSSYILVPNKRYDVFVVAYDLGTDPGPKVSPMAIVRIDAYERKEIHVVFHMNINSSYFAANQRRFLMAMNDEFNSTGWFFRVYDYVNGSSNLEVTIYALTSDITQSVNYMNVTKTYVQKDQLLSLTRMDSSGTPTAALTAAGGALDDFNIVLVEPEYEEPSESENFWLDTVEGAATIVGLILFGILLIGLLIAAVVWYLMRNDAPPPPPPKPKPKPEPKPEPVLKQEYKKQGPGPQILANDDDDEFVARPVKKTTGAEMRGFDAVTGREYIANPVTGERAWVENEGDFF